MKKHSYRDSRSKIIDKNIENLKKAGVRFHYDRTQRQPYQAPSDDLHQKTKNFIRMTIILVLGSGITAWLFYRIFTNIL